MMTTVTGVCAFPITPADKNGRIDHAGLTALVDRLVAAKVDSIGLLGSTGSYPYLVRSERLRAIEVGLAAAQGVPVVVGVGALRTDEAVRLAQDAKAAGVTAGLLAPVSYLPLKDDEVFEHFATVARESGLPLCIYDNHATTHFSFCATLLGRLSRIDGVVALKSPAPEQGMAAHLAALRGTVAPGCSVGYSVDLNATEALLAGGDAWYSVVAGLFPQAIMSIRHAVQRGDAAEARCLNAGLQPLWDLFRQFTSFRVMYAAANAIGLGQMVPPLPIQPLSDSAQQKVRDTIKSLDLLPFDL
jgi:4-hydroxy-tetrahydrodipicolinate synthase